MALSQPVAINHKLFRNSGTYGSPTWNEIVSTRDITISDNYAEADVSRRGEGLKQTEPSLREITIDFEMVWDTADEDFAALYTAYAAKTLVELAYADGAIGTLGTVASGGTADVQAFRVSCKIVKWEKSLPLEGAATVSITAKPCYTTNDSALITVA